MNREEWDRFMETCRVRFRREVGEVIVESVFMYLYVFLGMNFFLEI